MSKRKYKPVEEYDKFGKLVGIYYDVCSIATKLGINENRMSNIIDRREVYNHHTYAYYYTEDNPSEFVDPYPIKQFNSDGSISNQFRTITEAAEITHLHRNTISRLIKEGGEDYYGCFWQNLRGDN